MMYKICFIIFSVCFLMHQIDAATLTKRQFDDFSQFHDDNDVILQKLETALLEITNNYMQSLFDGTFNASREQRFELLKSDYNQLLDTLYEKERITDYLIYENKFAQTLKVFKLLRRHLDLNFNDTEINEVIDI